MDEPETLRSKCCSSYCHYHITLSNTRTETTVEHYGKDIIAYICVFVYIIHLGSRTEFNINYGTHFWIWYLSDKATRFHMSNTLVQR